MYKATFKMFRTTKVSTAHLWASAGLEIDKSVDHAREELKKRYAPFAPRLSIFWNSSSTSATLVGMEVMSFDVDADDQVPRAGIVLCDPVSVKDVHESDGALHSELQRFGLWSETKDYEWRVLYDVRKGDQ